MKTVSLLTEFVNKRPCLDFNDYGDVTSYRRESREITRDRSDYFELLSLAVSRLGDSLDQKLYQYLTTTDGRLTLENNKLVYTTGQYFPTEYRPAANRVLRSLIWSDYANEKENGNCVYETGHAIRKAIKRRVSRRVFNYYFN